MNLKGSFRSFGGEIESGEFAGQREEVWVELGLGKISAIKHKDNEPVAQVEITVEGADYPVGSWIRTDDEVFEAVQYAYDNKIDVDYRIECQRKNGIPKNIEIAKLRTSISDAKKNTTRILAGINDNYTNEAMTDPEEDDEVRGGSEDFTPHRTSAIKQREAVKAQQAQAQGSQQTQNNNPQQQGQQAPQRQAQSYQGQQAPRNIDPAWMKNREPAAYIELNPDNATIYPGSLHAQSFFSANILVRNIVRAHEKATGQTTSEQEIKEYTGAIIAIADKIHNHSSLFKRADRQSSHHTRIRGIVFDIVEHEIGLPLDDKVTKSAWFTQVGKIAYTRYNEVINLMNQPLDLSQFLENEATGNQQAQPITSTNPSETKTSEASATMEKQEETAVVPFMFPKYQITKPSNDGTQYATQQMIDAYMNNAQSTGTVQEAQSLLKHTFNTVEMNKIPSTVFNDFLNHYLGTPEFYQKAIKIIKMKGSIG